MLDGESQLGVTSTTDGTLETQGWCCSRTTRRSSRRRTSCRRVSTEFLEAHPDVADVLNDLMAALTTEKLTELNGRVPVDREKPEDVAQQWLSDNGLL